MKKFLPHIKSLRASIISNYAGNLWVAIIGLVFVPVYLSYIGPEGYGLIGIFSSVQVVLSLLDSGLSVTLTRELSRLGVLENTATSMRNLVKTLGTIYWGISLLAGALALCLSPLLAHHWVQPVALSPTTVTYAFMLLGLSVVFQFPVGFYSGGLMGLHRQVMLNVVRIIFATLKSVGAFLILAFVSKSVLAFFAWMLFVAALQALVMKILVWKSLPHAEQKAIFDKGEIKKNWRFAAGMTGIGLVTVLITQIDKVILSKLLLLEQFGYYTVATTLGYTLYNLVTPLTQSYFPKLSALASVHNTAELKKVYHQACQLVTIIIVPATMMLVFFSAKIIMVWTNNPVVVANTWEVTAIYALGTGLNALLFVPYQLTLAYGWTKLGFYQNLILLFVMAPVTILLVTHYGILGGAISWAAINILCFFITPFFIHKKVLPGELRSFFLQDCLLPVIPCVIIVLSAKLLLDHIVLGRVEFLLLAVCTGMIALLVSSLFASKLKEFIFRFLNIASVQAKPRN